MKIKQFGQVYTQTYIINFMLDQLNLNDTDILKKKILEPSAGNGNFVIALYKKIIYECKKQNYKKKEILKSILNIYAIEIDKTQYLILIKNIMNFFSKEFKEDFNFINKINLLIKENIICEDSLKKSYDFKFDYIIGNPPYVRLHNMEKENLSFLKKEFYSMSSGTVDLYYAFFEWSLNIINDNGIICFITPNSFLSNLSGTKLREVLFGNISKIYNFESQKLFESISTYNSITLLKKNSKKIVCWLPLIENNKVILGNEVPFAYYKGKIIISNNNVIDKIINMEKPLLKFKNGLATLADELFITSNFRKMKNGNFLFNGWEIEKELIKKVVKISTHFTKKDKKIIIFPYKIENRKVLPMSYKDINKYPKCKKYFEFYQDALKKRSIDSNSLWFCYGRSQAIQSILYEKVIFKNLVKNKILFDYIPKGTIVYSGLYSEYSSTKSVTDFLNKKIFIEYVNNVGFDRRGGYKYITSTSINDIWNK